MNRPFFTLSLGILGLGILLVLGQLGRTEQPPETGKAQEAVSPQEGIDFLARGPMHEAFATPTIRGRQSSALISKEPPKPIEELAPDQKPEGDNVQWIPGYWAWDDDATDFIWISGTYRTIPGRRWVPGYYNQTNDGWQRVAGFWGDEKKNDIELLPAPPDAIEEAVPQAPSNASSFEPGCWVYRDSRYMWRPGFWAANRTGWIWTPACYNWTPGGYIFVDGYWDYPIRDRGLLFAPVNIDRRYRNRAGWSYRPSYVVYDDFLMGSLFVRPSHNHYYFGDYYDSGYSRLGFVSWTDYRYSRTIGDHLFSYYLWQHRDNPGWSRDLRQLYVTRQKDSAARPARTNNMTALASLTKVDNRFVKLLPVTKAQQVESQKAAAQFRDFSTQRGKLEAQAAIRSGALTKATQIKLPNSVTASVRTSKGAKTPPDRPAIPEIDSKVVSKQGKGELAEGQRKSSSTEPTSVRKSFSPEEKSEPKPAAKQPGKSQTSQPKPPPTEKSSSSDEKPHTKKDK